MRAFAKKLDLPASHLSVILKGTKNLSEQRALRVSQRLDLTPEQSEYFTLLVKIEATTDLKMKDFYQKRLKQLGCRANVTSLDVDSFKMIADWYHIPILEMTTLNQFELTAASAAKKLGIKPAEADAAIERLTRLGLLQKQGRKFAKTYASGKFEAQSKNLALRHFHKQMLQRAIESLEEQSPAEKFSGSQTLAIDPAQLEQAKELTRKYVSQLTDLLNQGKNKTDIYHLEVQLFNLTKKRRKENV